MTELEFTKSSLGIYETKRLNQSVSKNDDSIVYPCFAKITFSIL